MHKSMTQQVMSHVPSSMYYYDDPLVYLILSPVSLDNGSGISGSPVSLDYGPGISGSHSKVSHFLLLSAMVGSEFEDINFKYYK